MKNLSNISDRLATAAKVVIFMGIISFSFIPQVKADAYRGVSFQVFYDELMPYGDWVQDPQHGFVWIPYVEPNFHPYATRGHWVMTSYGNTWVSQYDWGWAPFHYGRWFYTNYYGWAWVPGYEWGPAWVNWRTGGGYYGWAPLGPGMHVNMVFNMPYNHYVFVPHRRLIHRNIHRYYLPRTQIVQVYNHTTIINNTYVNNQRTYIAGPDRRELERINRRSIPVYQVNNSNQAGRASVSNRSVALYRPDVERATATQARPSRVVASNEYNRGATRTAAPANNQRQNSAVQRGAGQENRTAAPQNNTRREAVRSNEATAPARTAAPARNASPANVQRTAPAQYDNRVSTPSRQNNVGNREATAAPRQQAAQPAQRNAAPRVNAAPQQRQAQPQQVRQAAPQQIRQAAPQQQTRQAAPQQQVRQSGPAQRSAPAPARVQQPTRTSSPAAVSNSRSSSRSGGAQPAGQTSTRSNTRSSRGNN
jgi:hypothetical protein